MRLLCPLSLFVGAFLLGNPALVSARSNGEGDADQLGREYIYFAVSMDGVVQDAHFRGDFRANDIVFWRRNFDRIDFRSENTAFHFNPESPLSRVSTANISPALLAAETIVAEDEATGEILIGIDTLFVENGSV